MPRLRKEIKGKIEKLVREGYLDVERQEKTSVLLPTIRKIRRRVESESDGKEHEQCVESKTNGKKTGTVEFMDLKGKKIRFSDVVEEQLLKSGLFDAEEATLQNVAFNLIGGYFQDIEKRLGELRVF